MGRERSIVSAVPDEIVIDDLVGVAMLDTAPAGARFAWANAACAALVGGGTGDLAGRPLADVVGADDLGDALDAVADGGERTLRVAGSGGAAVLLQLSPTDRRGQVLVVARPAHSTPRAAMYDAVTGLASPELLREHLQLALNRRAREGDDLAVVAITATNFAAAWQRDGDAASLLQTRMAERVEQVVRDADVLSARRPGTFLLLVIDPTDAVAAATVVSERVLAAFATPIVMADRLQPLEVAIGIAAVAPDDTPDTALARADGALARAAREGTGHYRIALD